MCSIWILTEQGANLRFKEIFRRIREAVVRFYITSDGAAPIGSVASTPSPNLTKVSANTPLLHSNINAILGT